MVPRFVTTPSRAGGMNLPPLWAMYIAVPRFEGAVTPIEKLGGSELSPVTDASTIGWIQMPNDPQGAAFYIVQPEPAKPRPERA